MIDWPQWVRDLPPVFAHRFLGIAFWQWIGFAVAFAGAYVAYWIGGRIAGLLVRIRRRVFLTPMSQATQTAIRRAAGALCAVLAASQILDELYLVGKPETLAQKFLSAGLILGIVLLAYAVWDSLCDDLAAHLGGHERAEGLLLPMARKFIRAGIVVVGLLFAATDLLNLNVQSLIASLGIGGLVIALASKDSVENVFGSFTILFDMPFKLGDWVKMPPTEGIVEEINLRSTRIRTFEDTLITLPNANLTRASVENVSARRWRRQQITLRLGYDARAESLNAFCEELRAWLAAQEEIVQGTAIVQVSDFSETSIGLLVQCQFKVSTQAEELAERHALATKILELRQTHKVRLVADPAAPSPATPTS
jgi:MscS family membrane protein